MNTLKKLRHIYKFDSLNELTKFLGIPPRSIYAWSSGKLPKNIENLLTIIYEQKKHILKLEEG